jgi:hypothetical protein
LLRTGLLQEAGLPFADLLPTEQLDAFLRQCAQSARDSVFAPLVTLWTFLSQMLDADQSCRQAVARVLAFRAARGEPECSTNTGGYCKARQRLPEEGIHQLMVQAGHRLHDQTPRDWLWKGRRVIVGDGTTVSLPDTEANQEEKVVLITTILDPAAASVEELAELYRARWNAELDLRAIKQTMQMDTLRCKTPQMVRKEIWAHRLAYNLIRGLMAQSAFQFQRLPRELSFKGTLQILSAFRDYFLVSSQQDRHRFRTPLLRAIATHQVADRPGRCEPRAKKRRKKNYPLLMMPRDEARSHLLKAA